MTQRFSTYEQAREKFIFTSELGKGSNWCIEKYNGFEIRKSRSGCGGQSEGDFNLAIRKQTDSGLDSIYENYSLYSEEIYIDEAQNMMGTSGAYRRAFNREKYKLEMDRMKKMIDENKF